MHAYLLLYQLCLLTVNTSLASKPATLHKTSIEGIKCIFKVLPVSMYALARLCGLRQLSENYSWTFVYNTSYPPPFLFFFFFSFPSFPSSIPTVCETLHWICKYTYTNQWGVYGVVRDQLVKMFKHCTHNLASDHKHANTTVNKFGFYYTMY